MRTPNAACVICGKPLYRRPSDTAKARFAACMAHRAQAQSIMGVTEAQERGLALGRPKGTNHRTGYKHREESKRKTSAANAAYWAAHPDRAKTRARRGEAAYNWKGGISRLNTAIRQTRENRRWMEVVKARDAVCVRCGSASNLEAHHKTELAELVARFGIKSVADARAHADVLFDLNNGETLCSVCHLVEHGRVLNGSRARQRKAREARLANLG